MWQCDCKKLRLPSSLQDWHVDPMKKKKRFFLILKTTLVISKIMLQGAHRNNIFTPTLANSPFKRVLDFSFAQNWEGFPFPNLKFHHKHEKMCCKPNRRCSKQKFSFYFWKKGPEHWTPCVNQIFGLFFGPQYRFPDEVASSGTNHCQWVSD